MINYIQRKPINSDRIIELLNISSDANHFTNNGPLKRLLESKLEKLLNIPDNKRVLCLSNGTTALHTLMFYYNKLHNKQLKWITPSYTFPSCVVNYSNTEIVDIDPTTYTLCPEDVGDADGIIITNLFGSILEFDYNLFKDKIVIVDNASSFLSIKNGVNMNLLGNASFGSLHHTKSLGFGEGGFLVIDTDMYEPLQSIANFGFTPPARIFNSISSNHKMSDVAAAYIIQHIEMYDIAKHVKLQELFRTKLNNDNVKLLNYHDGIVYGNLPLIFSTPQSPEKWRKLEIEANQYYRPLGSTPNAEYLFERMLNLPLHAGLNEDDILYMAYQVNNNA